MCHTLKLLAALMFVGCSAAANQPVEDSPGDHGTCPADNGKNEECISEGAVIFDRDSVQEAKDGVYLVARLEWQPCGALIGRKTRSYRIDLATGSTTIAAVPADAHPLSITDAGLFPTSSGTKVQIVAQKSTSVIATTLEVGSIQTAGSALVPVVIGVTCSRKAS